MQRLTLIQPDDWHTHLRDGESLRFTAPHTAAQFARAIIMPNLRPPVTTLAQALSYRANILAALPKNSDFEPLMVLYLTDNTSPEQVSETQANAHVHGFKYYPAGATTNSDSGVTNVSRVLPVLAQMEQLGLPLLVHGEVTRPGVDVFDREEVFIHEVLSPVLERHPDLKVVFEHITTKAAVDFVLSAGTKVAATITPQHLIFNRTALFEGGLRPHRYCLPVLKREEHRQALVEAATSGSPKFFLGTDTAPHGRHTKEAECGCAGIFSAFGALELYAEVFDAAGALDQLEPFASINGPNFYDLPINKKTVTLTKSPWQVPESYPYSDNEVLIPLMAGERLAWKMGAVQ